MTLPAEVRKAFGLDKAPRKVQSQVESMIATRRRDARRTENKNRAGKGAKRAARRA